MPEISIDKETHIYKVDNIIRPSVSDILGIYFEPCPFWDEPGRTNGKIRHEWYNHLAQGKQADYEPDERISGAVKGFEKFMADVKPEYVSGEVAYYHPALQYCGTPDMVCRLAGRLALVDFKPKSKAKRTRVQTALYYSMLRANGIMVLDRYELRLYDGLYRLDRHEDVNDVRRAETMAAAYTAAQFYK